MMYDFSVIVCGCTKNSASYIEENITKLYEMNNIFKAFHFVVYENDSNDNTKDKLQHFKNSHSNFNYISERDVDKHIDLDRRLQLRPQFIAHGRNVLLKYMNEKYTEFDYMIMVDLDSVISTFRASQLKYIFNNDLTWDVLTANCIGKYYDIWALRIYKDVWVPEIHNTLWSTYIDYDCWEKAIMCRNAQKYVYDNQITIPVNKPLIPVSSSFGGFGIYKMSKIKGCFYKAVVDNKIYCEHVSFHNDIKNIHNAKIFICPQFVVNQQNEHVRNS
uniref:Glycosyltransferase 2-like domain-containing protein n=1 Tax=viral metagenome TaxID=1070528 RepID=A0A6C0EWY3_9ZZZZ